jgi:hypothetical protein
VANTLIGRQATTGQPVFVTGNGRSGTSWIGETLGRANEVLYYREPCHPRANGLAGAEAERVWCRHLRPGDRDGYFEATLGAAFRGRFWPGSGYRLADYRARLGRRPRVIVKEVASFLSLEWVAARWQPAVVVILRHPGAYAASVRNLAQEALELERFALLKAEPALRPRLAAWGPEVAAALAAARDPLEVSVASWAIRTRVALEARARHPDWQMVRYEAVAGDPVAEFRTLYARLGLAWAPAIEAWLRNRTSADAAGNYTTARVSAARIDAWRGQFSAAEIVRIRRMLEPFALPVYAEPADWPA